MNKEHISSNKCYEDKRVSQRAKRRCGGVRSERQCLAWFSEGPRSYGQCFEGGGLPSRDYQPHQVSGAQVVI